ncbi:MAG: ribonuclease Z [Deltaproteobacteria bacterium]|nr:MAG: ribonuclease Z [Deltaproteobacteria bacterium]
MGINEEIYINIVGSGTGIPSGNRGSPCISIRWHGHWFVFDLGPGSLRALTAMGIKFELLELIWITHFHPDHTADLVHFLFATKYPKILNIRKPFKLAGPPGLKNFIGKLKEAFAPSLDLPVELIHIAELDTLHQATLEWNELHFKVCSTRHTKESMAIRIDNNRGKSLVYSGDTDVSEDLVTLSKNADVLILEASFPEGEKVRGHLTPAEAGIIAKEAGVKRLILTHFYPECLATEIGQACRKHFDGEITVASDHLAIVL